MDKIIKEIARKKLNINVLESRFNDELDFHDLNVMLIKEVLEEAFKAGLNYKD